MDADSLGKMDFMAAWLSHSLSRQADFSLSLDKQGRSLLDGSQEGLVSHQQPWQQDVFLK
jgi:hypothetical protein